MLDQTTIDRVIDAANIVDVVSEYVTLRRAGANYKGLCPFHEDKTPSFHVSPAKGICKCFACGEGGNAVHFIMKLEQLSYIDAIKFLGKKYGIEVEDKELSQEQRQQLNEREELFAVNEWASKYYHELLQNNPDGRSIGLAYFRSRGFRDDIIEKFRLGFSLDQWDTMTKAAIKAGYKEAVLEKSNLSNRRENGSVIDKFRGRAMFPWFNVSGKITAFGGRVLDSRTKGVSQKYVNTSETPIYVKGRELYGIFQAKKQIAKDDRVYMVEGYTDVLSMHQCGIENVVANSGTALSESQIRLLHRFTSNITLLYDGDEAGIHAALRGTDMLLAEGMNVKILLLPDGDDPDSFARKHNATEFRSYVEAHQVDFIIFKTNLLLKDAGRDPQKRADLTKSIVKSISVIPEEITRAAYIHECSELMKVDEAILLRQIAKDRRALIEEVRKEQEQERLRQERLFRMNEEKQHQQQQQQTSPEPVVVPEIEDGPPPEYYLPPEFGEPVGPATQPVVQPDSQTSSDIYLSPIDKKFLSLERMLMTIVIRYGEQLTCVKLDDGSTVNVPLLQYVYNDLALDNLAFRTPLYAEMLAEGFQAASSPDFNASRFYMASQNLQHSQEAVRLMTERYQLSKVQQEQTQTEQELAPEYVNHLLLDYKFAVVEEEMAKCQEQMTDPNCSMEVLRQYMHLKDVQLQLAKCLGDRILN